MEIKYKNLSGQNITEEQAQYLDYYKKEYIDNSTGLAKKIETIQDGQLDSIYYYLDDGENENDIVELYTDQVKKSCAYNSKTNYRGYTLELCKEYSEKKLIFLYDVLYDKHNHTICLQNRDLITNEPIPDTTDKYYYDYNEYSEEWGYREIFVSKYNSDGSLDILFYMPNENDQDNESYGPINFSRLQDQFTEDLSYYLTSEIMPANI